MTIFCWIDQEYPFFSMGYTTSIIVVPYKRDIPISTNSLVHTSQQYFEQVETVESARIHFIILNSMYNGPLKDQKVRQAISYAVDIDGILNAVLNGYRKRMTGSLPDFNLEYVKTEGYA